MRRYSDDGDSNENEICSLKCTNFNISFHNSFDCIILKCLASTSNFISLLLWFGQSVVLEIKNKLIKILWNWFLFVFWVFVLWQFLLPHSSHIFLLLQEKVSQYTWRQYWIFSFNYYVKTWQISIECVFPFF